jgi:hypothetical protein
MDMSAQCSWCVSPARAAAEERIAAGDAVSLVYRDFALSRDQWKHHRLHGSLPRLRVEILNDDGGPSTVIPRLESLLMIVESERETVRGAVMVSLLRLERDLLGDIARLRGEFPQKQSMSVGDWAEWSVVLDALTPYPKAMRAVSKALTA